MIEKHYGVYVALLIRRRLSIDVERRVLGTMWGIGGVRVALWGIMCFRSAHDGVGRVQVALGYALVEQHSGIDGV